MSIARKLKSLLFTPSAPLDALLARLTIAALEASLRDARKRLDVVTRRANAQELEIVSLRRGSTAGMHEAAAAALDDVIDKCRALVGALETEKLEDAIARKLASIKVLERARADALTRVAHLEQVIRTSETIDATRIVMREKEVAVARIAELTAELATSNTRRADLEADVARLTSELAVERTELEELEEIAESLPAEEVGLSSILTELRVSEAEARKERDALVLDRDAKAREVHELKAKLRDMANGAAARA